MIFNIYIDILYQYIYNLIISFYKLLFAYLRVKIMYCEKCGSSIPNGINYCYNCKSRILKSDYTNNTQQQAFYSSFSNKLSSKEREVELKKIRSVSSKLIISAILSFVFPVISLIVLIASTNEIKTLHYGSVTELTYKVKKLKSKAFIWKTVACSILILRIFFVILCIIFYFLIQFIPEVYSFVIDHKDIFWILFYFI